MSLGHIDPSGTVASWQEDLGSHHCKERDFISTYLYKNRLLWLLSGYVSSMNVFVHSPGDLS